MVSIADTVAGPGHGDDAIKGIKYPEWDVHHKRYRHDWCTVVESRPRVRARVVDA